MAVMSTIKFIMNSGATGVEIRQTPQRTEFRIHASQTNKVLGENGRNVRELTSFIQKRFNFAPGTIEVVVKQIKDRGLSAAVQAESLRFKILA